MRHAVILIAAVMLLSIGFASAWAIPTFTEPSGISGIDWGTIQPTLIPFGGTWEQPPYEPFEPPVVDWGTIQSAIPFTPPDWTAPIISAPY